MVPGLLTSETQLSPESILRPTWCKAEGWTEGLPASLTKSNAATLWVPIVEFWGRGCPWQVLRISKFTLEHQWLLVLKVSQPDFPSLPTLHFLPHSSHRHLHCYSFPTILCVLSCPRTLACNSSIRGASPAPFAFPGTLLSHFMRCASFPCPLLPQYTVDATTWEKCSCFN